MKEVRSDIWILLGTHAIVIPTNMGWRRDGRNVMGAGLARQAREKCTDDLAMVVGQYYKGYRYKWTDELVNLKPPIFSVLVAYDRKTQRLTIIKDEALLSVLHDYSWTELIFVPSKKLVRPAHMAWKFPSDMRLVRRSLRKLKKFQSKKPKIAVPLIGAGNGGLDRESVVASVKLILGDDDRFTLVYPTKMLYC